MNISQLVAIFFNQGVVGGVAIAEAYSIWWLVSKRESDKADLIAAYERRQEDAVTLANNLNQSVNQLTDSLKDANRQTEQLISTSNNIAQSVQQLVFRGERP